MNKNFLNFILLVLTTLGTIRLSAQPVKNIEDLMPRITSFQTCENGDQIFYAGSKNGKEILVSATTRDLAPGWQQSIPGSLFSFQSLQNSLLLLIRDDKKINTIKALVLDLKTGKLQSEKVIYPGDEEHPHVKKVFVSADRKNFSLITREVVGRGKQIHFGDGNDDYQDVAESSGPTRSFTVATWNENLELIEKLSLKLPEGKILGIEKSANNDIYVATIKDVNSVYISRYNAGSETITETISDQFNYNPKKSEKSIDEVLTLCTDTKKPNIVYLKGLYHQEKTAVCVFNKYDFHTKQIQKFSSIITKDVLKSIEKEYKAPAKQWDYLDLGDIRDFKLVKTWQTDNGYMLIVNPLKYIPAKTITSPAVVNKYQEATYRGDGLLVFCLDNDLKIKSITPVPRASDIAFEPELDSYSKGKSSYIIASEGNWAVCLLAKLNNETGKLEDIKAIEPVKFGAGRATQGQIADLKRLPFSDQGFILPTRAHKLFNGTISFDLNLYRYNW